MKINHDKINQYKVIQNKNNIYKIQYVIYQSIRFNVQITKKI